MFSSYFFAGKNSLEKKRCVSRIPTFANLVTSLFSHKSAEEIRTWRIKTEWNWRVRNSQTYRNFSRIRGWSVFIIPDIFRQVFSSPFASNYQKCFSFVWVFFVFFFAGLFFFQVIYFSVFKFNCWNSCLGENEALYQNLFPMLLTNDDTILLEKIGAESLKQLNSNIMITI